jgi:hypothetical protein
VTIFCGFRNILGHVEEKQRHARHETVLRSGLRSAFENGAFAKVEFIMVFWFPVNIASGSITGFGAPCQGTAAFTK